MWGGGDVVVDLFGESGVGVSWGGGGGLTYFSLAWEEGMTYFNLGGGRIKQSYTPCLYHWMWCFVSVFDGTHIHPRYTTLLETALTNASQWGQGHVSILIQVRESLCWYGYPKYGRTVWSIGPQQQEQWNYSIAANQGQSEVIPQQQAKERVKLFHSSRPRIWWSFSIAAGQGQSETIP